MTPKDLMKGEILENLLRSRLKIFRFIVFEQNASWLKYLTSVNTELSYF
jgi:hypothetical protein